MSMVKPEVMIDPDYVSEEGDESKADCLLEISLCSGEPFFNPMNHEKGYCPFGREMGHEP
eukprot:1628956-Prorocentrum_lima.AAC.1